MTNCNLIYTWNFPTIRIAVAILLVVIVSFSGLARFSGFLDNKIEQIENLIEGIGDAEMEEVCFNADKIATIHPVKTENFSGFGIKKGFPYTVHPANYLLKTPTPPPEFL